MCGLFFLSEWASELAYVSLFISVSDPGFEVFFSWSVGVGVLEWDCGMKRLSDICRTSDIA